MKAEFNKGIESLKNWNKVKDEKLGMETKTSKVSLTNRLEDLEERSSCLEDKVEKWIV